MTFKASSSVLSFAAIAMLAACGSPTEDAADTGATSAATQGENSAAKATIEARQAGFKKLGKAFKTISDELRSGAPDMSVVEATTASIPVVTSGIENWFPAGTGPEAGVKTAALAAIWEKPADFATKVAGFKTAAAALEAAGKTGDAAAITAAFRATGGTCKACHDSYKKKDD